MKTYYTVLKIIPCDTNKQYHLVSWGLAYCWILENSPANAYPKIIFDVEKHDWKIQNIEFPIREITREDFIDNKIGLENYDNAQKDGISTIYITESRDKKTTFHIKLQPSYKLDISEYLNMLKKEKNKGRCLHYEAGDRCNEYIRAHSIQNKGLLAKIAENGHVYAPSDDIGSLKANKGRICYKKRGLNKISTFMGFCGKHDSELFEPIDTSPIIPSKQEQQIFLYAYRSLCKEIFAKENSLNLVRNQLKKNIPNAAIKKLFLEKEKGTAIGLKHLTKHKEKYDNSLSKQQYQDIQYVLFISKQKPTIVFSGTIYPDYDFIGRQLQNLANPNSNLELITFCSVTIEEGWGFLFAWHKSSSKVCIDYINSLRIAMQSKGSLGDFLFRLVTNCENHAISPYWWESLNDKHKNTIIDTISNSADPFIETPNTYLMKGMEGIVDWEFEKVRYNYKYK